VTFKNAQQTRVLAGGFHYATTATGVKFDEATDMYNVTVLTDRAKTFMPGKDGSNMSIDMFLDTDTTVGGQWSNMTNWKAGAAQPFSLGMSGFAVGSEVWMANTLQSQFNITTQQGGPVTANITGLTDGMFDPGLVLEDLTAVTADGNGTARDNGAATANGLVAHLHTIAFSGLTSDVVTIEHSVDGSTSWTTLVTFATQTAIGSDRQVVAPGTTVRRYLRVVDDVTGTGSITRFVSVARR